MVLSKAQTYLQLVATFVPCKLFITVTVIILCKIFKKLKRYGLSLSYSTEFETQFKLVQYILDLVFLQIFFSQTLVGGVILLLLSQFIF